MITVALALAALLTPSNSPPPSDQKPQPSEAARPAQAAKPEVVAPAHAIADRSGIRWINDDWKKAKADAAAANQLVAVDAWATWCHTCLSMKNFVFTDAKMSGVAAKHVWLAIDYDRPENVEFVSKFSVGALPTFMVIDPKTDTVVARWVGSGTVQQMIGFYDGADKSSKDPLVLGHRALAREDYKSARKIFEGALAKKIADRAVKTKLLSGWVESMWKLDPKACATKGIKYLGETDDTAPGVDFASMVAYCAESLDAKNKKKALEAVRDRLAPLVEKQSEFLSIDDQSGLLGTLISAYDQLEDKANAEKLLAMRAKLLEDAATAAPTAAERATFDAHRMEVYVRQGRLEDAEKMLLASEIAQPEDFNHPWRLANVYKKSGKLVEGLAAIDRALAKGYGGRRLRLFSTKVDLLIASKKLDWAKQTIAQARAEINAMHKSQVRPSWVKELDEKLVQIEKLEKAAS